MRTLLARTLRLVVAGALMAAADASFVINADLPTAQDHLVYKAYRNAWVLPIDTGVGGFSLALPQLCVHPAQCGIHQTSYEPLNCGGLRQLLLDADWLNANLANDWREQAAGLCPRSFADLADAQALLGSVTAEPFIYVTFPTTLVVRNHEALLARHARGNHTSGELRLDVRVVFLTQIGTGPAARFSVRQISVQVALTRPSFDTVGAVLVKSICKELGLVAPALSRLELIPNTEEPTCAWTCYIGHLKSRWNEPPSANTSGECRPLPAPFVLVEFSFALATDMPGVGSAGFARRLSQDFFSELDDMAAALERTLPIADAMVALTVEGALTDTQAFSDFAVRNTAWTHRQDLVLTVNNASLVVAALQRLGLYQRWDNPYHAFFEQHAQRRQPRTAVHDLTVKGLLVTGQTQLRRTFLANVVRNSLTTGLHAFPSYMQIKAVELADVKSIHRSGLTHSVEAPSAALQVAAARVMLAMVLLCVAAAAAVCCHAQLAQRRHAQRDAHDNALRESGKPEPS